MNSNLITVCDLLVAFLQLALTHSHLDSSDHYMYVYMYIQYRLYQYGNYQHKIWMYLNQVRVYLTHKIHFYVM